MLHHFKGAKGLLHEAAVNAHRAEEAFRDALYDMRQVERDMKELQRHVGDTLSRDGAMQLRNMMEHMKRHAVTIKHHAERLRERIHTLNDHAAEAQREGKVLQFQHGRRAI